MSYAVVIIVSHRAVWVVDGNDKIIYSELVPEITTEPDYDKVMEVLDSLTL